MNYTTLARQLRLAVITNLFGQGKLTIDEAEYLLASNLSLDDDSTFYNDSELLGDPDGLDKIASEEA